MPSNLTTSKHRRKTTVTATLIHMHECITPTIVITTPETSPNATLSRQCPKAYHRIFLPHPHPTTQYHTPRNSFKQ